MLLYLGILVRYLEYHQSAQYESFLSVSSVDVSTSILLRCAKINLSLAQPLVEDPPRLRKEKI